MKKFFLEGPQDYKLMSQAGVKQYVYPLDFSHNAIWDSNVSPDGRLFFGLASEIFTSGYVRLCEYDYDKNDVITHFKVEDVILPSDRTIRASKFHTSICFMSEDMLIMTTHTTDKSPAHPTWMPDAYYSHIWEGFPGSNIITYDRKTCTACNLGIPVPRESIYGALYEPKHNALYFLGFFKGHLYRYSLEDKKVIDLGKVSENYSFRLVLGPDGNIYSATRSGYVYKVDTEKLKVTDLNYRLPHYNYKYPREFTNISVGRVGPDNRLYFAVMYGPDIIALDTNTGKFTNMGPYMPAENYIKGENRSGIFGMDFDRNGVLWYAVTAKNDTADVPETGLPCSLFRWDIARGASPQWCGLLGTKNRVGAWLSEIGISKDNILFAVGSNHSLDGPDITAVDLNIFEPTIEDMSFKLEDGFYDPEDKRYIESSRQLFELEEMGGQNPVTFDGELAVQPIRLWRELAPDNMDNSGVTGLYWDDSNHLHGICGHEKRFAFEINEGVLVSLRPLEACEPHYVKWLEGSTEPRPSRFEALKPLPAYPGRQYKAMPCVDIEFNGNRRVVGTLDGMLAIVSGDSVYSLGPVAPNGPIHAMTVNPERTIVYGIAGDTEDMGSVFTYDDVNGLVWKGLIVYEAPDDVGVVCCTRLSCCTISKDGRYLAIASDERLGTVLIYRL